MSLPGERLRARIESDGPIPFAEFMEEALYGEGGYYSRAAMPIGPEGDFVTGSALSPLFGTSTARLLARLATALGGRSDMLEVGYGDGSHLQAVLDAIDGRGRHGIWAWDRVAREVPDGVTPLTDLDDLERPIEGLVFSYELFDALPVHRLRRTEAGWQELRVGLAGDRFDWVATELALPELEELAPRYAPHAVPGQLVDLSADWRPLYRRLVDRLDAGLIVTCDYGFDRRRLLDGRVRRHGTLACYRRQTVHRNPFVDVGRQDLTAHVDFTALIEEGEAAGLATVALVSQTEWLGACGVFDGLAGAGVEERWAAAHLLDPAGMGTAIRVLVQRRGVDAADLFDLPLG